MPPRILAGHKMGMLLVQRQAEYLERPAFPFRLLDLERSSPSRRALEDEDRVV